MHKKKLHKDFSANCQVAFCTMTTSRFAEHWRTKALLSDWNQQNQSSSLHLQLYAENLLYCIKVRRCLSTKQRGKHRDNNSRVNAGSTLQPSSLSSDNSYFCSSSLLFHNTSDEEILFQSERDQGSQKVIIIHLITVLNTCSSSCHFL